MADLVGKCKNCGREISQFEYYLSGDTPLEYPELHIRANMCLNLSQLPVRFHDCGNGQAGVVEIIRAEEE